MIQLAVVMKDQEWTLFEDARPTRTFLTRSAAIEAAEARAFELEEAKQGVELVIQDYRGELSEKRSWPQT